MKIDKLQRLCYSMLLLSTIVYADIGGVVFQDLPLNGTNLNSYGVKDSNELGVAGVSVTGVDSSGNKVTATTASDGSYVLQGLNGKVRVEFSNIPSYLKESPSNSVNNSSVRFVNDGDSNVDFGVHNPSEYNPGLDKTAFAVSAQRPWASAASTSNKNYAVLSLPYSATGQAQPSVNKDVSFEQIGTTWGAAYQKNSGILYESAFLKRHSGLGELVRPDTGAGEQDVPVDGIYMVKYDGSVGGSYIGGFTLNNVTPANGDAGDIDTGTVTREVIDGNVTTSNPNALTTNVSHSQSYDIDAFGKVGKVGFGDADIDESGKALWVVNLNQKSLIKIDVSNPSALPTSGAIDGSLVSHYNIDFSSLGTCDGEFRPWALAFHNGKGYVGVVCDSTQDTSNAAVHAYILSFNPTNPTGTFNKVKDFPLTYLRESSQYAVDAGTCSLGSQSSWNRWANSWDELGNALGRSANSGEYSCPQPILSDITFDSNGDMILGFLDRFAEQLDYGNYAADTGNNKYFSVDSAGDTLHLCKTDSGYLVEGEDGCKIAHDDNEAKLDDDPSDRAKSNDGPNGDGEFYYKDYSAEYDDSSSSEKAHHLENNLGSVVTAMGSAQILVTTFDAIEGNFNQGFQWYNTNMASSNPGDRVNVYQISKASDNDLNTKGSGLGDVELITAAAPIEVGNRVWKDTNKNGIQDANENGIDGVTVQLVCGGDVVSEATTANGGYYIFSNDPNGEDTDSQKYNITQLQTNSSDCTIRIPNATGSNQQSALSDLMPTDANSGSNDNIDSDGALNNNSDEVEISSSSISQAGTNNHSFDFGFKDSTVCLGDKVWNDTNANGIQDSGEAGVSGVTVKLQKDGADYNSTTTDSNGEYKFCNLQAGTYKVIFDKSSLPAHYTISPKKAGNDDSKDSDANPSNGESADITINNGDSDNLNIDMGIYKMPCLGDFVWVDTNANGIQDTNEVGVDGIKVELLDNSGNTLNTTTTANGGKYEFCDLEANSNYQVKITPDASYQISPANQGVDDAKDSDINPSDKTAPATVATDDNMTIDAGIYKSACLGDRVWEDTNKNGLQDSGENGIKNVTIHLLNSNGDELNSTTTDTNGNYQFCSLNPGDYKIKVDKPSDYEAFTTKDAGSDESKDSDVDNNGASDSVTLTSGDDNKDVDAGMYKPTPTYCLGDKVWNDTNANGIQDSGEAGVSGVTVKLQKDGADYNSTTTDSNGEYKFCNLQAGTYKVIFDKSSLPAHYTISPKKAGNDDSKDSDANPSNGESADITINNGDSDNLNIDMGIYKMPCLGDFVWVDTNANGIQDTNEVGVDGIKVELLDNSGNTLNTTTTANGGKYEFCDLEANSNYQVKITPDASYQISPANQGVDDAKDSDINPSDKTAPATVATDDNMTIDAGIYKSACLGDRVWEDTNKNGLQDSGENGIKNVTIHLLNSNGDELNSTTTDTNGNYQFCSLNPGDYKIKVDKPSDYEAFTTKDAGSDESKDSDVDNNGASDSVTLTSGDDNKDVDAGMYKPTPTYCLGDYVWEDTNKNGIQDANESGVKNVTVKLYKNGTATGTTTTTDTDGKYQFCNLENGDYSVEFDKTTLPNGYEITTKDAGSDDSKDSDADTTTGKTAQVTIKDANNTTLDMGIFKTPTPTYCLGDYVWEDTNKNGIQDSNESGVANVTVKLLDENGTTISTKNSEADGAYKFCNLKAGNYYVEFDKPTGYELTQKDAGSDDSKDSDANTSTGKTDKIILSTSDNLTVDAGIVKIATPNNIILSGHIFNDGRKDGSVNGDPINKVGDEPLYVTLVDSNGEVVASKEVNSDGTYTFTQTDGLEPNSDYTVILSTQPNATTPSLPDNWSNTGEMPANSGTGDDGSADGKLTVHIADSDAVNNDFGINEKPKGSDHIVDDKDAIANPPGHTRYPVDLNLTDREDTTPTTVTIKTLPNPSDGVLYYDGKPVTAGEVIKNFDTRKLTVDPADGNHKVEFTYTTTDNAGVESKTNKVVIPFVASIQLGDFIWLDKNLNGIQDAGEPGVVGVKVVLLNEDGTQAVDSNGNPIVTTTDNSGHYLLDNVKPGSNYQIKVEIPETYNATLANVGDESLDSDANSDGIIKVINPTENNNSYDVGIYCDCDDYKIHPQNHKKLKMPALNLAGLLVMLLAVFILVRRKEA